jgi:hypothetical protein
MAQQNSSDTAASTVAVLLIRHLEIEYGWEQPGWQRTSDQSSCISYDEWPGKQH